MWSVSKSRPSQQEDLHEAYLIVFFHVFDIFCNASKTMKTLNDVFLHEDNEDIPFLSK